MATVGCREMEELLSKGYCEANKISGFSLRNNKPGGWMSILRLHDFTFFPLRYSAVFVNL